MQTTEPRPSYELLRRHKPRLPILAGLLRGWFWLPASGGKTLRVMLGTYEAEQTALFDRLVGPGDVVFDVGAAMGYYTLLAAKSVGRQGRVIAFEPEPKNMAFLRQHVAANRLKNVSAHQSAVGDHQGTAHFGRGRGSGTGRVVDGGELVVSMGRLDDIVEEQGESPTHIKIDVEGLELQVLRGSQATLARSRPTIFLSTHGPEVHEACCQFLNEMDYVLEPIGQENLCDATEILCRAA